MPALAYWASFTTRSVVSDPGETISAARRTCSGRVEVIRAHNSPAKGPRPKDALPHARVHDLRHIHATILLLNGVPVHVVAARLGHADPAITLRVYAHIIRDAETAAADVFVRVMTEPA
jgi:integrase